MLESERGSRALWRGIRLLVSLTGISGVDSGHTFTPSPDGLYVIADVEYQYAPLRVLDLQPALDSEVANINRPISAWTANWARPGAEPRGPLAARLRVRLLGWPSGLLHTGPAHLKTTGHYDTFFEFAGSSISNGAWGIDVRNADGLVVVSDTTRGSWALRMEGCSGWNGLDWGVPNTSSVQDGENGPAVQAVSR